MKEFAYDALHSKLQEIKDIISGTKDFYDRLPAKAEGKVRQPEIEEVWKLIQRHQAYTKSARAAKVLADWKKLVPKFVKVLPKDYARVLQSMKKAQSQGLTGDQAIMAAFEENVRDVARVRSEE